MPREWKEVTLCASMTNTDLNLPSPFLGLSHESTSLYLIKSQDLETQLWKTVIKLNIFLYLIFLAKPSKRSTQ